MIIMPTIPNCLLINCLSFSDTLEDLEKRKAKKKLEKELNGRSDSDKEDAEALVNGEAKMETEEKKEDKEEEKDEEELDVLIMEEEKPDKFADVFSDTDPEER